MTRLWSLKNGGGCGSSPYICSCQRGLSNQLDCQHNWTENLIEMLIHLDCLSSCRSKPSAMMGMANNNRSTFGYIMNVAH